MNATANTLPLFSMTKTPVIARTESIDPQRLTRAKAAYTTRFAAQRIATDPSGYSLLSGVGVVPSAGDIVLARVHTLGQHGRIEGPDSRRASLFEGDEILVAYGDRYAPDQFEAHVPTTLGHTNLAAAGGVAGDVLSAHTSMDEPTVLEPIGLLSDAQGVVTLRRCAPFGLTTPRQFLSRPRRGAPPVIAVLGTSMNSGKTTTVASIVRGLTAAGLTVAAGKVTGTGAGGDPWLFGDSGAATVMDFTSFGYASTYLLDHDEIRSLLVSLVTELSATGPDAVVLEIADGLFQRETARLIEDPLLGHVVHNVVFAAGEALGAIAGRDLLTRKGLRPVAVSGRLTASPLATRETTSAVDIPVLDVHELASPNVADLVLPRRGLQVFATTRERGHRAG